MKHLLKKCVAYCVVLIMMVSMSATMHAESISFSDVPAAYWGYTTIMRMTSTGMFQGTSEPINGVGTFMPEKVMTRAEFITAVLRAIYPEESKYVQNGLAKWWYGYYNMALNCGLLYADELNQGAMDLPMSRQEMAMVLVRGMAIKGEEPLKLVSESQIADYTAIGAHYQEYVRKCFSLGLICGVDANGTFAPEKSLTRAEAATVLCRLVFASERVQVSFLDDGAETSENTSTVGGLLKPVENEEVIRPSSGNSRPDKNNTSDTSGNKGNNSSDDDDTTGDKNNGVDKNNSSDKNDNTSIEDTKEPEDPRDKIYKKITLDKVLAMNDDERQDFRDWLEKNGETYEGWLNDHQEDPEIELPPWEEGGKSPDRYTLNEYLNLSDDFKYAFEQYFGSQDDFYAWLESKTGEPDLDENDVFDGMTLEDFTFDNYFEMNVVDQSAFCEYFFGGDDAALFDWLDSQIEEPEL